MNGKSLAELILEDIEKMRVALGRYPSRDQYLENGKYPKSAIVEAFGSWTAMLAVSGVQYSKGKRDKQEIRKEAFEHLKKEVAEKKLLAQPPKLISRLLCISDMHAPYGHTDTHEFLFALDDKYKFDHVLIGGDEIDHHALSFHDSDPNLMSAGHELEAAIAILTPLYRRFPVVDILSSNHGDLVYRKGKHHGIPRQVLRSYRDILRAPDGWNWQDSFTLQLANGKKIHAHHGISKNYLGAAQQLGMNFVQFHYHNELGIRFWFVNGELFFAMQCGCFVDDASAAMAYNKLTLGRPVIGCTGVLDGVPRLFPMIQKNGRWTGFVP